MENIAKAAANTTRFNACVNINGYKLRGVRAENIVFISTNDVRLLVGRHSVPVAYKTYRSGIKHAGKMRTLMPLDTARKMIDKIGVSIPIDNWTRSVRRHFSIGMEEIKVIVPMRPEPESPKLDRDTDDECAHEDLAAFCAKCGRMREQTHHFCPQCGWKYITIT